MTDQAEYLPSLLSTLASLPLQIDSNGQQYKALIEQITYELETVESENDILRRILAASSDPILITTPDAKIMYVNPAWERLTGYTFEEIEGQNPKFLNSGKTPKKVFKQLWNALINGQSFITEEVIDKRKDGSEYQIHSTYFPVMKNNQPIFFVQLLHDITHRKHLEDLKKEFLSAAAHELKTPITVLKLMSQMHLKKSKEQGADKITHEELLSMDHELHRLTELIDDILDSTRIETGKLRLSLERTDLISIVSATIKKMQIYASDHMLIFLESDERISVIADKNRLEQVLINLLSNAIKYSSKGTMITVTIKKEKSKAIVSVADQGIGILKKDIPSVFDRFYQVERYSRNGFGLGLYISKEIIKRHKGKIWVTSKKSKGSIFYFSLPLIKTTKSQSHRDD